MKRFYIARVHRGWGIQDRTNEEREAHVFHSRRMALIACWLYNTFNK